MEFAGSFVWSQPGHPLLQKSRDHLLMLLKLCEMLRFTCLYLVALIA